MDSGNLLTAMALATAMLIGGAEAAGQRQVETGGRVGQRAPDFPPGVFTDGAQYAMKDFEGRVVVLYFYEQNCPRCRAAIPGRNALIQQYQGRPVVFIAIAAGDTLSEARAYTSSTRLAMPAFADALSVMEKRYGFTISLNNIWQTRVIGPDGIIVGNSFSAEEIDKALARVKWKYLDQGYDERLNPLLEMLEGGNYADAIRRLKQEQRRPRNELAEQMQKLLDAVMAEGEAWMKEAEQAAEAGRFVEGHDLYARVAIAFASEEMGRKASQEVRRLAATLPVRDEMAARRLYQQLCQGASGARSNQRGEVAAFAQQIVRQYGETPTGKLAAEYLRELGGG